MYAHVTEIPPKPLLCSLNGVNVVDSWTPDLSQTLKKSTCPGRGSNFSTHGRQSVWRYNAVHQAENTGTVEFQWFEYAGHNENMFETGVVLANEC